MSIHHPKFPGVCTYREGRRERHREVLYQQWFSEAELDYPILQVTGPTDSHRTVGFSNEGRLKDKRCRFVPVCLGVPSRCRRDGEEDMPPSCIGSWGCGFLGQ